MESIVRSTAVGRVFPTTVSLGFALGGLVLGLFGCSDSPSPGAKEATRANNQVSTSILGVLPNSFDPAFRDFEGLRAFDGILEGIREGRSEIRVAQRQGQQGDYGNRYEAVVLPPDDRDLDEIRQWLDTEFRTRSDALREEIDKEAKSTQVLNPEGRQELVLTADSRRNIRDVLTAAAEWTQDPIKAYLAWTVLVMNFETADWVAGLPDLQCDFTQGFRDLWGGARLNPSGLQQPDIMAQVLRSSLREAVSGKLAEGGMRAPAVESYLFWCGDPRNITAYFINSGQYDRAAQFAFLAGVGVVPMLQDETAEGLLNAIQRQAEELGQNPDPGGTIPALQGYAKLLEGRGRHTSEALLARIQASRSALLEKCTAVEARLAEAEREAKEYMNAWRDQYWAALRRYQNDPAARAAEERRLQDQLLAHSNPYVREMFFGSIQRPGPIEGIQLRSCLSDGVSTIRNAALDYLKRQLPDVVRGGRNLGDPEQEQAALRRRRDYLDLVPDVIRLLNDFHSFGAALRCLEAFGADAPEELARYREDLWNIRLVNWNQKQEFQRVMENLDRRWNAVQ